MTIAKIKKEYEELTDMNDHCAAALLLVKQFGTEQDVHIVRGIQRAHIRRGYIIPADQALRDNITKKYHKRLYDLSART